MRILVSDSVILRESATVIISFEVADYSSGIQSCCNVLWKLILMVFSISVNSLIETNFCK